MFFIYKKFWESNGNDKGTTKTLHFFIKKLVIIEPFLSFPNSQNIDVGIRF